MKRLLICRHAKSSWSQSDLRDFDRPLNQRGERDAPEMGRRLAARGLQPELICASPAARALATAHHYAQQLGYPVEQIRTNAVQYAANVPVMLQLVQAIEAAVEVLMVVGHNPESTALANVLGALMIDNIPTSGIVGLDFAVDSWQQVAPGKGSLVFFDYPKNTGA